MKLSIILTVSLIFLTQMLVGQEAILSAGFIYESAPFPECHASTIEETPSGLVAAWFGGTREKNPDVGIWVSRQEGESWSVPVEVANGIQHEDKRYPTWNPVLFYDKASQQLLLFFKAGPTPSSWWGMLTVSTDDGASWTEAHRLPEDIQGPVKNKPVLLADGRLLCGSSTEHDGWKVQMEITSDLGKNWKLIGPLEGENSDKVIQPTILIHGENRYQILCRTKKSSKIMQSWSEDGGNSWRPFSQTSLPNPNSGLDGVTLADGRHLLVYNHTKTPKGKWGGPRSPLNLAISDDGILWKAVAKLETAPGEYSYPAVIQASDGKIHVTYTWKRERIKHVVLDPGKLGGHPMPDGEWVD
ncbi:MAG: sialidase family protein [Bacteroidota bacterium]